MSVDYEQFLQSKRQNASAFGFEVQDSAIHPMLFLYERDIVVDPFIGGGATALAAQKLGRRFIGSDSALEYIEMSHKRLAQPYTPNMFETPLFHGDKLYEPAGKKEKG